MQNRKSYEWMFTIIPLYAIGSGLAIFIPLYILSAHGTVFEVGLAIALYNFVSIPSALFWGRLTDKTGRNKPFIVLSAIFMLPIVALFFLSRGVEDAFLAYALYAVAATAAAPAINILVIWAKKGRALARAFSRYSIFVLAAAFVASVVGVAIITDNLMLYAYFLLGFDIVAILLSIFLVKEHPRKAVSEAKRERAHRTYPILSTLASLPGLLLGYNLIEHIRMNLKDGNTKSIYQLMTAIALFNLGFYVFYTSLIPFQRFYGLTYSNVFIVQLASIAIEIPTFFFIMRLKKFDLKGYYMSSITLMSTAYILVIMSKFLPPGPFFYLNIIAYAIVGLAFVFWNLSSAVLLYDKIRGIKAGFYIGLWTSFLGGSAIAGAFISGFVSSHYGYAFSFVLAAVAAMASGLVFALEFERRKKKAV